MPALPRARRRLIGPSGLAALKKYKYNAEDLSVIAPYLQWFWNGVCRLLPSWLAPNCVTVGGLLLVVLSVALCWSDSPFLDAPLSSSVLFLHAALLFGYQTLDAVDGKQARRTGSSGPLGELCDHTCDALVCTLLTLTLSATLLAGAGGSGRTVVALWLVGTWPFALCTWRMLHTGKMTLPVINGPNEGMAILYCTCALTAALGQERLWGGPAVHLPLLGEMRRAQLFALGGCTMGLVDSRGHLAAVARALSVTKRGSGATFSTALSHLLPYCLLAASLVAWTALSPTDVAVSHIYPLLLGAGFQFSLLMGRLILAHLSHEQEGLLGGSLLALLPFPLAALNAAAGAPVPEAAMVWLNLGVGAAAYLRFSSSVASEICELLGIRVFSLHKRKKV